jgi:hypothetical protein
MKNVYIKTAYPSSTITKEPLLIKTGAAHTSLPTMRGMMAVILSIIFIFNANNLRAQNCPTIGNDIVTVNENTYYPATASVAAGGTALSLGPIGAGANFGSTPIAAGDIVLIIQMQGATYNLPPTTTNAAYGSGIGVGSGMLAANLQAGKMEFAIATNAVGVGGGVLNISAGLTNAYAAVAWGATGQYTYQVIRVPQHFNLQLGATINTPQWNGSTGGVTVLSAVSQFDFNGQTVNGVGAGFRGGGGRSLSGQAGLSKNDYYGPSTNNAHASKGEGVAGTPRYLTINNVLVDNGAANEGYPGGSYARGAPGNAGGGASDSDPTSNDQNAGGGGGGNGGAGGLGGNGWFSFGFSGGKGGTAFQTYVPTVSYYSPSRLIMGGGGGAGTSNNGSGIPAGGPASGGATGGGLIIINSTTIIGTGTVNVSGGAANNTVTVDGSGGGAAGGSILIFANSGQAGITAIANGSDGASNTPAPSATQHGPGGGGGGGVIFSNGALNPASSVAHGNFGISTGSSATNNYGADSGRVGVLTQTFPFSQLPPNMQICQTTILPVTILNFGASYESSNLVKVSWTTTDEVNASYFVVERSSDAVGFGGVATVNASEASNPIHSYSVDDQLYNINSNIIYYRLRIVDKDGKFTYSKVVPVKLDQPQNVFSLYPNPVDNYAILSLYADKQGAAMFRLIDNAGKTIITKSFTVTNGNNSVLIDQLGSLPRGVYIVQVMANNNLYNQKIIKK